MIKMTVSASSKDDEPKTELGTKVFADKDERRTPASLDVPSWDGSAHSFSQYRHDFENMKHVVAKGDYSSIGGRLTPKLTGSAKKAVYKTQVRVDLYDAPDGYLRFRDWTRQAVGITEHQ